MKESDASTYFQFFRAYFWVQFLTACVGFLKWGFEGVLAAVVLSLIAAPVVVLIVAKTGGLAVKIYTGSRLPLSIRERLVGDVDRVRHLKTKKEYQAALRLANDVLRQDPENPEALLLKAGILWEGYENAAAAKSAIEKILTPTSGENESIRRWASNLRDEINRITGA